VPSAVDKQIALVDQVQNTPDDRRQFKARNKRLPGGRDPSKAADAIHVVGTITFSAQCVIFIWIFL
jgi:hypothetical protein